MAEHWQKGGIRQCSSLHYDAVDAELKKTRTELTMEICRCCDKESGW